MIGIVTGLRSEARCLSPGVDRRIVATGGNTARVRQAASALVEDGARGLLSFGLAGGLAKEARPGDLLLAETVVLPDGACIDSDPKWLAAVEAKILGSGPVVHRGRLAGSERLLASEEDKRRLGQATEAIAVDMESHAVAEVAREAGVPFLAIRAIADPADQALPEAARQALDRDGRVRPLTVARCVFDRPGDLWPLLRLWRQSARAHATLRRVALLAGPTLDLG